MINAGLARGFVRLLRRLAYLGKPLLEHQCRPEWRNRNNHNACRCLKIDGTPERRDVQSPREGQVQRKTFRLLQGQCGRF